MHAHATSTFYYIVPCMYAHASPHVQSIIILLVPPLTPTPKSTRTHNNKSPHWFTSLGLSPLDHRFIFDRNVVSPITPRITRSMTSPTTMTSPNTRIISPHIRASPTITSPAPLPRSPSRRQRGLPARSPNIQATPTSSPFPPPSPATSFNTTSISASLSDLTPTNGTQHFGFGTPNHSYVQHHMATTPIPFLFHTTTTTTTTSTTSTPESTSSIIHTRSSKHKKHTTTSKHDDMTASTLLALRSSPTKMEDIKHMDEGGKGPHKKLFQKEVETNQVSETCRYTRHMLCHKLAHATYDMVFDMYGMMSMFVM